jgi:hypothetical protein
MGVDYSIIAVDDGSRERYAPEALQVRDVYWRYDAPGGKRLFWQRWNDALTLLESRYFDYLFALQDDFRLSPAFFVRCVRLWKEIERCDERLISLNPFVAEGRRGQSRWTGYRPERVELPSGRAVWDAGWVDCHFMSTKELPRRLSYRIREISAERWERDPALSSGVGRQISLRLRRDCCKNKMYQVDRTLMHHGDGESIMNPRERKQNPLRG